MNYAPTFVQRPSKKTKVFQGSLVAPGFTAPSPWLRPDDPLPDGPFTVYPGKSPDVSLTRGVGWASAIMVPSVLIVRKSLAEPVLRPLVTAGDVVLRTVKVLRAFPSKKLPTNAEVMDEDFVLVDVRARFPVDRAMLPADAWEAKNPKRYASLLEWVPPDTAFGKGRAPRAAMFRVGEQPSLLLTERSLFTRLDRALGGALREGEMGPRFGMLDAFTEPRFKESAEEAEAAANAFYRMFGKKTSNPKDRALALKSPTWAYWVARLVDSAPKDDTRQAASGHPFYGYAYARDVDRGPHAVTRKAVRSEACAAREYAIHVDREVKADTRKALAYSNATGVERAAQENAARFAKPDATSVASAPSGADTFVMVGFAPDGRGVVQGSFRTAGAQLHAPYSRLSPPPGVFMADEYGGKGRLRRQKSLSHLFALRDGEYGPVIVRKSAVASLFAKLSHEVKLVPVTLHDASGRLDPDFALLDVTTYVPLDPIASKLKLAHARAPVTGGIRLVDRLTWSPAIRPRARIFRVLELPYMLFMDAELCAALEKATARAVRQFSGKPTTAHMSPLSAPPAKVSAKDEAAATAAMAAFARYAARAPEDASRESKKERAAALAHPRGALAVATALDRAPRDDTRKAVLSSPTAAVEYALLVDRGPHPLTRKAATKSPQSTYRYVRDVDIGFHPQTRASFGRPTWGNEELRGLEEELAEVRRELKGNAPPR
jgi:hypothetical protein